LDFAGGPDLTLDRNAGFAGFLAGFAVRTGFFATPALPIRFRWPDDSKPKVSKQAPGAAAERPELGLELGTKA
jgi:hypothetical protein